jgi:hypothetical protein
MEGPGEPFLHCQKLCQDKEKPIWDIRNPHSTIRIYVRTRRGQNQCYDQEKPSVLHQQLSYCMSKRKHRFTIRNNRNHLCDIRNYSMSLHLSETILNHLKAPVCHQKTILASRDSITRFSTLGFFGKQYLWVP